MAVRTRGLVCIVGLSFYGRAREKDRVSKIRRAKGRIEPVTTEMIKSVTFVTRWG